MFKKEREVFQRDLYSHIVRVGIKQTQKEEVEGSKKDRMRLTKIVALPLVCESSKERARPEVSAIRLPSRVTRDPER